MTNKVERFYDKQSQSEWERLVRHRMEFAVTMKALQEYLPHPPASVLDIGGGPGRYAIELTRLGYSVTLLDLSQANLDLAAEKALEAGVEISRMLHGNALSLTDFEEGSQDAVLLMGPLYHLVHLEERQKAVAEASRVLKPGGLLFAAFISRYGVFVDASAKYPEEGFQNKEEWEQLWKDGINRSGFTDAYFAMPDEIIPLMEKLGLETMNLLGLEAIVSGHEDKMNALQGEPWEYWVDLNYRFAKDPALHAVSNHLLYVGKSRPVEM